MRAVHGAYRRALDAQRRVALAQVLATPVSDLDEWLSRVVPAVLDAQRGAVMVTDGYFSLETSMAAGGPRTPWGIDPEQIIGAHARRGVPLEDVYARTVRSGADIAQRLTREVATDVQLARRDAAWIRTEGDPRVIGYRRVLGVGGKNGNCSLCVAASSRTYKSSDLQPIHSHCGCTSEPIIDATKGAPVVDGRFLADLQARVGDATYSGPSLITGEDVRAVVGVSPELGPVLVAA